MINNMEVLGLTPNEIKQRLGHTRWTTTVDRYGNHNEHFTDQANKEVADSFISGHPLIVINNKQEFRKGIAKLISSERDYNILSQLCKNYLLKHYTI